MAELIANRYAAALFDIALEKDSIDKYLDDAALIRSSIENDPEFQAVLKHPRISGDEKLSVLVNAFKGKVSDDLLGLFAVAFRKNREAQLFDILTAFIDKVRAHKGIVTATVVSAIPLSEAQLDSIRLKLAQSMNKQVDIEHSVDKSLIGGIRINVCGQLIDNTVRRHLDVLKERMSGARLAD